jgi:hypothetical protein
MEITNIKIDDKNYQEVVKEGEKIIRVNDLNQDKLTEEKAIFESLDKLELTMAQIQVIMQWYMQLRNIQNNRQVVSFQEYVSQHLTKINEKLKVFKK